MVAKASERAINATTAGASMARFSAPFVPDCKAFNSSAASGSR